MADPLIGKRIGQYEVVSQLGQGGMAAVYRVHQANLKRDVAMKVVSALLSSDPNFKERFSREVEVIARLEHAHIVPVHEHGITDDGMFYLTMRYFKGGTLAERIHGNSPIPLQEVNRILRQVADALDHAHKHGVIHRDIKPSNVLMDEQNNVYLTDFGLARMIDPTPGSNLTEVDTFLGTPAYVSPEQITQSQIDGRSDIYSLAVVVYEMVAGRPPFAGDSAFSIMRAHVDSVPPPVRQFRPDAPQAVETVLQRALSKKPSERYQTATEFADDFTRAIQGEIITQRLDEVAAPLQQTQISKRPQPTLLRGLLPLAALILIALVLLFIWHPAALFGASAGNVVPTLDEADRPAKGTPDDLKLSDQEIASARSVLGVDSFIGFVACSLKTDYHASLARAVRTRAQQLNLYAKIEDSGEDKTQQPIIINRFVAQGAKAIIMCELDPASIAPALKAAEDAGVKVVRMGDTVEGTNNVVITLTNETIGLAVGNYAGDYINNKMNGKATIAILDYPDAPPVVERADAMKKALKEKVPNATIVGNYTGGLADLGEKNMEQALQDHPDINVILSINDAGAYGAIKALEKAGKQPDEVRIFSVDAETEARRMMKNGEFFIASLDSGTVTGGRLSVDAVVKLLAGAAVPKQIFLPGEMVTPDTLPTATP